MDESSEKPDERPTRRRILKLTGAAAAAAAAGIVGGETVLRKAESDVAARDEESSRRFKRYNGMNTLRRKQLIDQDIATASTIIRSEPGRHVLEDGSDEEIFLFLAMLPAIPREALQGTPYDIPATSDWPSVMIGSKGGSFRVANIEDLSSIDNLFDFHVGNGVFIARNKVLTNWHVIETTENPPYDEFGALPYQYKGLYERGSIDLAVLQADVRRMMQPREPRIFAPETGLTTADVHGRFIQIPGLDTDIAAAKDHTKLYSSLCVAVTPRMVEFFRKYGEDKDLSPNLVVGKSFFYLAPPGEALKRRLPAPYSRILGVMRDRKRYDYMEGMSGAPVLMDGMLAGVNFDSTYMRHKGIHFDIGFFHGPEEINKANGLSPVAAP